MRNSILIIALLLSTFLYPQNHSDTADQMIDKMCSDLKQTEDLSDSLRIESINNKFILPYLTQFSDSERQDKIDHLYFRFQKRCQYFRDYLQKTDPVKSDNWVRLNVRPNITISESEINKFKNNSEFYYLEYDGDKKTIVKTDNTFWIETFPNGTNSKLYYKWIGKNKFELEFIESNNNIKKNFSKKEDRYIYEIINKENNFYWILLEAPNEIVKFKLFVGK
ncbi:hypothetical protein LF887_20465 [Chryseobacterium sp. MEBOG06]|uniref:hypothetical protein n=1 Tax=Chryseobacterium sp. MEBOG06 TaxID=2879938 RepID=UPI001F317138|nr:hypothetical protein [Chryseobacterium sp. MEBOG06]UKB83360.1 hypothetical protein LF887_20465 [Chryseobacterium sp. MEBOG06]